MRLCDFTFAYTETSGGIRTYIDHKRRHLLERTDHEHILIIPGDDDRVERDGRATTYIVSSPLLPGCEPYRFFTRPAALLDILRDAAPDVIELGGFFLEPWVAFRHRATAERPCLVSGYFHTDLADAYFGSPVRDTLRTHIGHWHPAVAQWGDKLGDFLAQGAAGYFGSLFRRCDLMLAATPAQAANLSAYGVDDVRLIPLGVDTERFHPRRRSSEMRARLGANENTTVLIYAGRLDSEKNVPLLLDAFAEVRMDDALLVLVGEGPLRAELAERAKDLSRVRLLPYEKDPDVLATLLASADLYVTAGAHETFGLSVIEAQASGLPVIGVDAGALRERVLPEIGRLGPVGDATAMARNIEALAPVSATLRPTVRKHVERSRYDWSDSFSTLIDLYHTATRAPSEMTIREAGTPDAKTNPDTSLLRQGLG